MIRLLIVVPLFLMAIYNGCQAQYFSDADTMSIESANGAPGDTVAVTIDLANSFVVGGFLMRITYADTVLSALDMQLGSRSQDFNLFGGYMDLPGIVTFYATSWDPIHNFITSGSGSIAILRLLILPSAPSGEYAIKFEDTDSTSHENSLSNVWGDSLVVPLLVDGQVAILATNVNDEGAAVPSGFALAQNYPNPFNGSTRISFTLDEAQQVDLTIFDLLGRPVARPFSGWALAGEHVIYWDTGSAGAGLASGSYFYKLRGSQGGALTKMMTLLK